MREEEGRSFIVDLGKQAMFYRVLSSQFGTIKRYLLVTLILYLSVSLSNGVDVMFAFEDVNQFSKYIESSNFSQHMWCDQAKSV